MMKTPKRHLSFQSTTDSFRRLLGHPKQQQQQNLLVNSCWKKGNKFSTRHNFVEEKAEFSFSQNNITSHVSRRKTLLSSSPKFLSLLPDYSPKRKFSSKLESQERSEEDMKSRRKVMIALFGFAFCSAMASWLWRRRHDLSGNDDEKGYGNTVAADVQSSALSQSKLIQIPPPEEREPGLYLEGLRDYRKSEISKHKTSETGIWVTYKDGVYDITKFVEQHPGGEKILLAAGSAIDPFWAMYANHKNDKVFEMLEELRIGNISKEDINNAKDVQDVNDPYANDPERYPALVVRSQSPFNAEPPLSILMDSYLTPNELFFVRNHLPVPPKLDGDDAANSYRLKIEADSPDINVNPVEISLNDLKNKFPKKTIVATIQCAGNRRSELAATKPVKGLDWGRGAISTAEWSGVLLRDVLKYANFDVENFLQSNVRHVHFEGMDVDPTKTPYAGSVPVEKALNPIGDVLIAYEMNGKEIPRDHGYPIRIIIPGVVGARNVKWLNRIKLSKDECDGFWQKRDYKGFSPGVDFNNANYDAAEAIIELPVQSAICVPEGTSKVQEGDEVTIKGYAWSGGGRKIIRVDLAIDDGKEWLEAELKRDIAQAPGRAWAWTPFEANVKVPKGCKKMKICSRAVDEAYNLQPERPEHIWNIRGVLCNNWSCINVDVEEEEEEEEEQDDNNNNNNNNNNSSQEGNHKME